MCTPPRNWGVPRKFISRRRAPKNKSRGSLLTLEVGQIWPGSGSVFYQLMVLVSLHYSMLYYRGKVLSRDKIWWQGGGRSSAMWQADPPSEETRGNSVKICMNRMLGRMYQWNVFYFILLCYVMFHFSEFWWTKLPGGNKESELQ